MSKIAIKAENLFKNFQLKQKISGFWGNLSNLFSGKYSTINAVNKISFSVNQGELIAFIGPNGAGKSTTIKMLTGILFPTGGNLQVLNLNPSQDRQELAYHIGSVFGQKSQLWYHLCPFDTYNLLSHLYELDRKAYQDRLNFLVDSFEIKNLLKIPVRKLSLGQRMRCEIVASLLHKPKILFLDEPTIGLDVIAKQQIRKIIKYLNETEQVTIFLTSHDAGDVEVLAQRTIVINHGSIIFDDSTQKFKKNFITTKIIELIMVNAVENFNFPGGTIIEKTENAIKIEINPACVPLDKLLNYAVNNFEIKDINIFDPPMEEIIAHIYKDQKQITIK
ncbi:MAG: ATP-binding cassette domain-containing protein [Candidatus Babeliales bacterium]